MVYELRSKKPLKWIVSMTKIAGKEEKKKKSQEVIHVIDSREENPR
jgi:hypothetical protein